MPKPSVLVVEDELDIQQPLTVVLRLEGFHAFHAEDVDGALEILDREKIDAISLDVRMPDPQGLNRDGLTLLRHLRSTPRYARIPVLLLTGVVLEPEQQALAARLKAKVFMKPQPYDSIVDELSRYVRANRT
jgi:two-component system chemotaxis response regulator CheY